MECQDTRVLLAYFERNCERLDAPERDAIQKHLDACPDCAALAAQERAVDQALGSAMRDVAIPAGLQGRLLDRLARERGPAPWKRWTAAGAAAILLAVIGSATWHYWPKPEIGARDIVAKSDWSKPQAEDYLREQGLNVVAPARFKYEYLRQVDVVVLHGRSVARLTFRNEEQTASAEVFILPAGRFDVDGDLRMQSGITIREGEDDQAGFIYIIHHSGNLQALEAQGHAA